MSHTFLLLLGAVAQLAFTGFMAMFAIFSGASIVDRNDPGPFLTQVFTASMLALPMIGLFTVSALAYAAFVRPEPQQHLWHLLSLGAFGAYVGIAALTRR